MSVVGHNQLRAFVERIERLEEEISALNSDKSEIYKEAKGTGFNVKVLRKVIAVRRQDTSERQEFESLFDMYMAALGDAPESLVRARVENIDESGVGAIVAVKAQGRLADAAGVEPPTPDQYEPPSFLTKPASSLRPHCLHPDNCAGYGRNHCHACLSDVEAA